MNISKDKNQKYEYNNRALKRIDLKGKVGTYQEIYKTSYKKLNEILADNVKEFNRDRFHVTLSPNERKILQRRGILMDYLKTVNKMNDAKNNHYSLKHKIKMINNIDFPE